MWLEDQDKQGECFSHFLFLRFCFVSESKEMAVRLGVEVGCPPKLLPGRSWETMGESILPCAVPGESYRMFPRHKRKERHLDAYTQNPVQGIQTGTVTAPEPLEHLMGPRWSSWPPFPPPHCGYWAPSVLCQLQALTQAPCLTSCLGQFHFLSSCL